MYSTEDVYFLCVAVKIAELNSKYCRIWFLLALLFVVLLIRHLLILADFNFSLSF